MYPRRAAGTPGTEAVAPARGGAGLRVRLIDYSENMHVWHDLGADGVRATYADTWCRACESPLAFDVMAHPDLGERFRNEGLAPTSPLEPLWDQMAACARDTGRRIEVSTARLRKSVDDYYPAAGLLERFARAGVPITFGSDAHRAVDICWEIRERSDTPTAAATARSTSRMPTAAGRRSARLTPRANLSPPDGGPARRAKRVRPFWHGPQPRRLNACARRARRRARRAPPKALEHHEQVVDQNRPPRSGCAHDRRPCRPSRPRPPPRRPS